jgi:hypothetical protein
MAPSRATDMGSRRKLVQTGKTGPLYTTGDVQRLASAIEFPSSQPERAEKMDALAGSRCGRDTRRRGVVLPSDVEGQSLALLDAMGAELGVGASEVAEIKNKDKIDDAADLADRLLFLIANPALRKAAGQAAKRRIRER